MAKTITPNKAATLLFNLFGSDPDATKLDEEVARLSAQFSRETIDRLVERVEYANRIVTSNQARTLVHHGVSKAEALYFTVPEMDTVMDVIDHRECPGNIYDKDDPRKLVSKACPFQGRKPLVAA